MWTMCTWRWFPIHTTYVHREMACLKLTVLQSLASEFFPAVLYTGNIHCNLYCMLFETWMLEVIVYTCRDWANASGMNFSNFKNTLTSQCRLEILCWAVGLDCFDRCSSTARVGHWLGCWSLWSWDRRIIFKWRELQEYNIVLHVQ